MSTFKTVLMALAFLISPHTVAAQETVSSDKTHEAVETWSTISLARRQALDSYLIESRTGYDWFTKYAFSQTDGTPFIILKLLPVVAPEHWGSPSNFLDVVGLFKDTRNPDYPIATGVGLSVFNRDDPLAKQIDYASLTCASCHIGRVKDDKGNFSYLDGGVNAQFNFIQYQIRIYETIQTLLKGQTLTTPESKAKYLAKVFLEALDKVHATNPNFFYQNYKYNDLILNAAYEKQQINIFKENATEIITKFIKKNEKDYEGLTVLQEHSYGDLQAEFRAGFPGMADATGVGTTNGYAYVEGFFWRLVAKLILPPTQGITDFMAVWEQNRRTVSWDETKTKFHSGGGQWNGNIPIPIYRNLAAQLSTGLSDIDIRVSAYSVEFLNKLPAPVYPFDIDLDLARVGKGLFEKNCVSCHRDNNDIVYSNIGTDISRAQIINNAIRDAGIKRLAKVCSTQTKIKLNGQTTAPCADFRGVSLEDKQELIMGTVESQQGYNALPLGGIWARAPYLHNGSVPTLHHLLMPESRPEKFVKSRLTYDKIQGGFSWKLPLTPEDKKSSAYVIDTSSLAAFSNKGHDEDINDGSTTYKLNWSDDPAGAKALIEYLKTL